MKLVRYGANGTENPGVIDNTGKIRSLVGHIDDVAGTALQPQSIEKLRQLDLDDLPEVDADARLGPCVGNVGKLICIGLNYSDHAKEAKMELPPEPVVFMKATSAICGPHDNIELPQKSRRTDWEVELGFVIGKRAKNVKEESALEHVAGYCIVNDLSERDWQLKRAGQWVKGKSFDTFAPIGPWLVTRDEIENPQDLDMWLEVDGDRHQDGSTTTMVFGVSQLVAYLSQCMTLEPGDIVTTGTPPGVGMGKDPQVFLKPGQTVKAGINGLGEQCQKVVDAD